MLIVTVGVEYKVFLLIYLGLGFLQSVLDNGWNMCLFDFSGSGVSDG